MWNLALLITLIGAASAAVKQSDVQFYLTNTKVSYEPIAASADSLSNFNAAKEVKIICHGWVDDINSFWYADTKNEYLKKGNANIIAVDWSAHAKGLYSTAVNSVEDVGYYVALLVLYISDVYAVPLSKFHLIGHSLGSHISGFAGQHIIALRGQRLGRITGLDPASPNFDTVGISRRLSPDDADFVDVIHTDGGSLGLKASVGHVDYFPNGGVSRQNGCGLLELSCSHKRAPIYFYESINTVGFIAVACSSKSEFDKGYCANNQRISMGENVDRNARGDYYLKTATKSPFALGYV